MTAAVRAVPRRGRCPYCGSRQRLRRDGTIGLHHTAYPALERTPCPGTGGPPQPVSFDDRNWPDCGDCMWYLHGPDGISHAVLWEGICSVAIENGRDPQVMYREFVTAYHDRDHQEAR